MLEWLGKAILAITWPLVKRQVEELAQTAATRRAVFGEMVKLRLEQYVLARKLDEHKALGIAQLIREELGSKLNFAEIDPASEAVRTQIARAVTLKSVNLGTWVVIDQLATKGRFPAKAAVSYRFQDPGGTQHNGGTQVFSIQGDFLFHKPIAYLGLEEAEVNPEVAGMAKERLANEIIRVELFEVGDQALLDPTRWARM